MVSLVKQQYFVFKEFSITPKKIYLGFLFIFPKKNHQECMKPFKQYLVFDLVRLIRSSQIVSQV